MASYIEINDLGSFASINALWAAYPEGGQEGDYCTIDGVKYRWDKYDRMWVADPNFGPTPARNVDTFYGDVNIHNNLTVAGTLRAKGINNPCVGFFPSEEALEEKWPTPKVGWWAIVGDTIPGEIYHCVTEGEWTDSGETGGSGEIDLTEYAKLTDIPEIADDLVTNSGTKTLSARQGKILNEKIPPVVDSLTSTSATSSLSAKQGKVLNDKIPAVVDNLTTSSPISALSAKQGKILKTLIDNIGSINVQGIQGFWPIDSLDDLPLSPTLEQKRFAYLYENALYIYVGAGGDTLDGKYKSTQLVTLDWNDKAYAPSIYNGLGRTTLKKNMVEGVNVLTSAMIGTANTEYFIQYDYDLDGAEVTLPANAGLVFMGGSIKNGTLIGNNTRIQAKRGVCIFEGITIKGTWDVAEAYSSWFKMHKKGYKIKSVTENGTTIDGVSYATFRVEGYNADSTVDYVAAPSSVEGTFDASGYAQYDDTASLQSLFDIRAKKIVVEDGIYIIKGDTNYHNLRYNGIYVDNHSDCEIVLEGWLKVLPNNRHTYYPFQVISCQNILLTGNGGIQGDLLDHLTVNNGDQAGQCIDVANTKNLIVEGLTFAYAWGDCVYCHWWTNGREGTIQENVWQQNHTFKNVKIIYGGRTGLVYERGDNVVVDSCYFYGTGKVRGTATYAAVDIEPFGTDAPKRYVKNFEFKNNVFENSREGLRLERCVNCSVHDNEFDGSVANAINIVWHKWTSYLIDNNTLGFLKSYLRIYDNIIKNCAKGFQLSGGWAPLQQCEDMEIYGNTLISCSTTIRTDAKLVNCKIYNNTTYGCGQWIFTKELVDTDIYHNRNYACRMANATATVDDNLEVVGGRSMLIFYAQGDSSNSTFHHNTFSLDYGVPLLGLGADGKEEKYHGLPLGRQNTFIEFQGGSRPLSIPYKVRFYENKISDDFYLSWGAANLTLFNYSLNTVRNEASEVFLVGDTFMSDYGDEGIVESGAILSNSWLTDVRDFSSGMAVATNEIIKNNSKYKICRVGGTCGSTLTDNQTECGDAVFTYYPAVDAPIGTLNIRYTTRGRCTSTNRPSTFLFKGRKMYETNTGKNIMYDGTAWAEEE